MFEDPTLLIIIGIAVAVAVVVVIGLIVLVTKFYRKVEQGKALIINKTNVNYVSFNGGIVWPIVHKWEEMDISLKTIEIDRRGKDGLICQDNIRADIKVSFFVRVNKTEEDVLKVAQSIGCARASHQDTLETLFNPKFSEALKTVGKAMEFETLYTEREKFRNDIIRVIGEDLNGYKLEDAAIDFLEQTPIEALDADNVLDAQGIEKIRRLTMSQHILTNEHVAEEQEKIKKRNVDKEIRIMALDREEAEKREVQKREILQAKAKNESETRVYQAQQLQTAETERIKATQDIALKEEQKMREVEIAKRRREGAVSIENERIEKETGVEAVNKEREVELRRYGKDKDIEKEKKEIADIVRGRVAVEKTVAQEEELIKDVREIKEAERKKTVTITDAEAAAQGALVREIKAAEAQEQVARFDAKKMLTIAEAELEAASKQATAKQKLAEGTQAEEAASGLAAVRVKEANAVAIEKEGAAEANVLRQKMEAQATGSEQQGMAAARVKEADAGAVEKYGLAEAGVTREKGLSVAEVTKQQGLSEAVAVQEKLQAEARGLADKAEAMKALDGVGREHEEYRIRIGAYENIQLKGIEANRLIAEAQARVLAEAMKSADINIVGGDGEFFDRFVKAVGAGKSVDGFVDHSEVSQKLLGGYLDGSKSLPDDLKDILSSGGVTSGDVQNLSAANLMHKLAGNLSDGDKSTLMKLLQKAKG